MNKTVFFRFVLVALFLVSYQSSVVHTTKHALQKSSECYECVSSQQLEHAFYQTAVPFVLELGNVQLELTSQKVTPKLAVNTKQKPSLKRVDFTGLKHFFVSSTPLGYFSTAPPYTFS